LTLKINPLANWKMSPAPARYPLRWRLGLCCANQKAKQDLFFFDSTPTGTAGIRGTQFQLASRPNTGMQLDVAESQVAFTPAGQNQPVVVGPGRGLDSSPSGQIKQRPINPIVSQNISSKNSVPLILFVQRFPLPRLNKPIQNLPRVVLKMGVKKILLMMAMRKEIPQMKIAPMMMAGKAKRRNPLLSKLLTLSDKFQAKKQILNI
jgi:hypothetical protein